VATCGRGGYYAKPASVIHFQTDAVCVITCMNNHQKSHHAEIPSFFIKPRAYVCRARRTAGAGKNAAATTSAQPEIASGSAMIVDLQTNQVIYSSHPDLVRPIASITKLMTAMVVLDAHLPLDEK
jgi:D-alanyl-D-alanine carboxypeptidase